MGAAFWRQRSQRRLSKPDMFRLAAERHVRPSILALGLCGAREMTQAGFGQQSQPSVMWALPEIGSAGARLL